MSAFERSLRARLRAAGLTTRVVNAAWPAWWSEEAEESASAVAELQFTLARRLGMSSRSLMSDGDPEFIWFDETKYKNRGTTTDLEAAVLASFSVAVSRDALAATQPSALTLTTDASELRSSLLGRNEYIGLRELVTLCWGLGIPILNVKIFPLQQKRMHAVTARLGDRYAILVGRQSQFQAQVAFWIAHELGHIARGDVRDAAALMDVEDPLRSADKDGEENGADAWALELLTGDPGRVVESAAPSYKASDVAAAVLSQASTYRVDPGVLALCLGHNESTWEKVMGALKILGESDVGATINLIADRQLDWDELPIDSQAFLRTILGIADD